MEEIKNENELNEEKVKDDSENKTFKTEEQTSYTNVAEEVVSVKVENKIYEVPASLKPISSWGYFGYIVLFSIPIIGFIVMAIFALGGTKNINLKHFARSQFCIILVLLIIIGISFFITGAKTIFDELSKLNFSFKF